MSTSDNDVAGRLVLITGLLKDPAMFPRSVLNLHVTQEHQVGLAVPVRDSSSISAAILH